MEGRIFAGVTTLRDRNVFLKVRLYESIVRV